MIRKELFMDDSLNNIENNDLIIRYLSNETNEEESQLLINWMNENIENRAFFESIRRIYNNNLEHSENNEFDAKDAWSKFKTEQIKIKSTFHLSRRIVLNVLKLAAILVLGYVFLVIQNNTKDKKVAVNSSQSVVNCILPDGSRIALNKNSNIQYLKNFGKANREISLSGEAFFEVKKDKKKPFVVHINNLDIEVVGTSFNVNAYSQEMTEVIVKTGVVKVINHNNKFNDTLIVKTGEKAKFVKNDNKLIELKNDDPNYMGWKSKVYVFDQTKMADVAKILEKDFSVSITFADAGFKNCILFARFENQSLNDILTIIKRTFNIEYTYDYKCIVFKGKGC